MNNAEKILRLIETNAAAIQVVEAAEAEAAEEDHPAVVDLVVTEARKGKDFSNNRTIAYCFFEMLPRIF